MLTKYFNKIKQRYGGFGFIRIAFSPITTLFLNPIRLSQTLWRSRNLINGKWGLYPHFSPYFSLNSLFYWSAAQNIDIYGRNGISPLVGLGNFPLSRWFHYSLPSLYLFWRCGAATILIGMFGWWFTHIVWIEQVNYQWLFLVMFLMLISTSFYSNTFVLQNYNVIGWLFTPLGLYSMATGQWILATLAWLAASFGSFTVVILAGVSSTILAITSQEVFPVLSVLPAIIKLLFHFLPTLHGKNILFSIKNIAKGIGISNRGVNKNYKRIKKIDYVSLYYIITYSQFVAAVWLIESINYFAITGLIMYIINQIWRYADDHSTYMFMNSIATMVCIQIAEPVLLISYWLVVSPIPLVTRFLTEDIVIDILPIYKPFSLEKLKKGMEEFLKPVLRGQRVLMAFNKPTHYFEIFDGYRALLELPIYVSTQKGVHFMPDWWAVFETNYEGAEEFWGRKLEFISENVKKWDVDYIITYIDKNNETEALWDSPQLNIVNRFHWSDYNLNKDGLFPFSLKKIDWLLLKVNKQKN